MADCSRPPHRNQRGLAKNLSGGFGFGSRGVYDDVFAARPKMRAEAFTPGAKDYAEIFNCKQRSSIPVLELEEFEVRSSEVDYGNVFGRLDEGQIVSGYEEVFPAGDGVGRTDDSSAHSRGSDRPTAVEESRKLTHESLRRKERSMSFDNNRGGNGETDEINSQAKNSDVPVSTGAFDGTVLLRSAEVSRSGALMNNFKQCGEEAPVEKHSRNVSSGGFSKHDDDGFMEIDVNSGNRCGSDKSMSSNMPMDVDVVRSKALISEAIIASNYISHLGSPVATSKELAGSKSDECRSNASKDPCGSSREGVEVQNVHGLDKPFVSDSAEDESVARQNAVRSEVICSSGLTPDHGCNQVLQTANDGAYNTTANETAADGIISHSQQDVQCPDVNCSGKSSSKFPVNATAAGLQAENSKSIPETHSQHNFGEPNTAAEGDLVPETAASRNADSESTDGDSNGHLTSSVKPEAGLDKPISSDMPVEKKVIDLKAHNSEVAPLPSVQSNLDSGVPILKKATTSESGEFRRSTYSSVRDDHAPSFSDDEIDKNSVAAISAAAIKTAIREAQAWISIAKESDGVKGFMKHIVAKNFRQVKEEKEAINLKVKEKPKLFEQGQTAIGNNSSTSATRKDYVAPWATSLETKTVPGQTVEEVNFKETEFCASESDRLNQREDAVIRSSSRKTLETASTIQHAAPSISTSDEKLTVYSSKSEEKLVHRKEDTTTMRGVNLDSGLASLVQEAKCFEVPNTEKRETNMASTGEAVINKYDETKIRIAEESQEPINSDQGFTMRSFQDAFGHVGCSVNSFEVKEDLASAYLEEENEKESELDPRDQLSDYDDTDLQDYASAEENLVSTDTDDETCDKDLNSPARNQLDDIEDNISLQSMVEATTVSEDVSAPCFNNSNEEPGIEETDENEVMPLQNKVTHDTKVRHSNEDSVVEETDVIGDLPILNTVTPEAKNTSEDGVAPCFDRADEESIVEETGGIEHMSEQNMVIPEADIVSEDVVAPCSDSLNEYMIVEEIIADMEELTVSSPNHVKAVEDVTEQNTAMPEVNIISEDDIAPYFDSSNEGLMVDEMLVDTTEKAGMSSPNQAHEKGAAESATCCIHEHATFDEEELENVASVDAESASVVGRASSHPEGPGVELPRRDDVSEDSVSETIKESRSTPWSCEHEKQEVGAATSSDLEPRTQAREELHNVTTVESDFIGGFESIATRGSENNQVNIDSAREEEVANELESTPLYPDHVDHELKAGSRFCEPLPNFIQTEETTNFEHHSESLIQPLERHERKKWEIPKEAFELPEVLKSGISEVHDTLEQDSCELKRQTDKHERKKWEIPRETFKLPVLDAEVVGVIKEKEDQESFTLSAEKPERKKWKIQKEVFEVPTLFAEAVQETSEQEGFVIKTASEEEMRIRDDRFSQLLFSDESDQHGEAQKEFSADEEVVVPDEGVFPGICADNSPDHVEKEWMPEIKMLGEEERVNQFNETCDQQETKVEEGAAAGQEECTKGQEDINVKDELKRTLGMLWKKIYKSQQDEDLETGDSMTEENYTFKDEKGRGGVDKGLNLKGPVELVESPRQQDDIEALNFSDQSSGDEENEKETSFSKQFEANGSEPSNSGDFISTTEVTEDSSSASFPCKLQEDDSRSCTEETCKQYYTANDVESRSKEIPSSLGSVGSAETTQIHGHGADKSLNKGSPEKNTPPSDVNECGWIDCEAADNINTSLVTRKAKTDDDKPSRMEATGSMRKEVTPDQEVLNNIMRAKEIERIVVERTIREVRERAFAEARERADRYRANAEAQQKALADDQERSQETSSEAKLAAEKNSLEGKRKSELERAAVERATAEARQRALEKAMSRQEQVSDGSSSKSANAADHGSSSKDRITNDKPSESALRFKSRNERHQRIAERAAKALEEKNMRDLLVQREQAERSRLSEVLDADVKRWASGKTSNLRALLSTLQYILGPDSGWKPIHLTDILTADAVKKAYRKATLFIHPDKLQQRGASIKQKYICEQVFDLLKEAWNNFDRDER